MRRARIVGMGAYAPKRILTNDDLEKMVATSDEWIVQRSGIRERRIADESEATSDLAVKAAQQALERAKSNKTAAAKLLGLSRATLRYRLEKYGIGGAEGD